ncbi:MAG: helix-turn-helix transcriptional regulator [Pseudorhodoplanes sp.]|nr:MAG: helix-turn-helix transcriptional regulator [Pseudorhodoplanes sp.]
MTVRFQKTAKGESAILPRKDYERLVARTAEADEGAGTARLVAKARNDVAAGLPLLSKDVVDRLARGENPVRVLREWRDVTQLYLAHKTNISQSHISDIESGRRTGTPSTLRRLADALNVPLDLLVV